MRPLSSLDVRSPFSCISGSRPLGRDARGLFHDGKAHAGLVAVLFRHHAPGILGFLAGLERTLYLGRTFHELVEVHRTELATDNPKIAAWHDRLLLLPLAELVHRIMGAAGLQSGLAGEVSLVIVADVRAGHILMLRAGDALTDFLALNGFHIAQHTLLAEIVLREIIGRKSCRVIGWQRDQMMEDAGALGRISLEGPD